jgi:hypothetical protein
MGKIDYNPSLTVFQYIHQWEMPPHFLTLKKNYVPTRVSKSKNLHLSSLSIADVNLLQWF